MIRGLLLIGIFGGGFLLGGAFPSYSVQYKNRLFAQYDQVSIDLEPFQVIANRYHGGSLEALVGHHLDSNDATFRDEGLAIQAMLSNQEILAEAQIALSGSLLEQARYIFEHAEDGLVRFGTDGA